MVVVIAIFLLIQSTLILKYFLSLYYTVGTEVGMEKP